MLALVVYTQACPCQKSFSHALVVYTQAFSSRDCFKLTFVINTNLPLWLMTSKSVASLFQAVDAAFPKPVGSSTGLAASRAGIGFVSMAFATAVSYHQQQTPATPGEAAFVIRAHDDRWQIWSLKARAARELPSCASAMCSEQVKSAADSSGTGGSNRLHRSAEPTGGGSGD